MTTCCPILVTILLSFISYRFIERPFRNVKTVSRRYLFISIVASLLFLLGFSLYVVKSSGLPERFENNQDYKNSLEIGNRISELIKEKHILDHRGECLFGKEVAVDEFIDRWSCKGDDSVSLLFIGDSHSADKAASLNSVGIAAGWLSGGNCSLIPANMTQSCRKIFDHARSLAREGKYRYIALSVRYDDIDLTERKYFRDGQLLECGC